MPLPSVTLREFCASRTDGHPPQLLDLQLELTTYCNHQCVHCYVLGSRQYAPVHLPAGFARDLLLALEAEGTLVLGLTGGEVLLHPDFPALYRDAVSRGFLVTVLTNGTLIDESVADLFAELPPWYVSVSVYGATDATYAAVTGAAAGFEAQQLGIQLLKARDVSLRLKFMALRENRHEVGLVAALAESLGAGFQFDGGVTPAEDGCLEPLRCRLSAAELARLELSVPGALKEIAEHVPGMPPPSDHAFQCMAGQDRLFVDARGWAGACVDDPQRWPVDRGDVRGSLRRIFYEELPRHLERHTLDSECLECELWSLCRRCASWRFREAGNYGARVPFFCELAQAEADLCRALQERRPSPGRTGSPDGGRLTA